MQIAVTAPAVPVAKHHCTEDLWATSCACASRSLRESRRRRRSNGSIEAAARSRSNPSRRATGMPAIVAGPRIPTSVTINTGAAAIGVSIRSAASTASHISTSASAARRSHGSQGWPFGGASPRRARLIFVLELRAEHVGEFETAAHHPARVVVPRPQVTRRMAGLALLDRRRALRTFRPGKIAGRHVRSPPRPLLVGVLVGELERPRRAAPGLRSPAAAPPRSPATTPAPAQSRTSCRTVLADSPSRPRDSVDPAPLVEHQQDRVLLRLQPPDLGHHVAPTRLQPLRRVGAHHLEARRRIHPHDQITGMTLKLPIPPLWATSIDEATILSCHLPLAPLWVARTSSETCDRCVGIRPRARIPVVRPTSRDRGLGDRRGLGGPHPVADARVERALHRAGASSSAPTVPRNSEPPLPSTLRRSSGSFCLT